MEKFNKTDKQEIILSAAEKLFALHGFDGTTTRMLASEANVNIAMLSYYYGSKEQLFKALLESRAANFYSKLQEAKGSSPILIDKVVALLGVYVDRIFENNLFHRIIQRELSIMKRSDFSDGIAKTLLQNAFLLKETIKMGVETGEFKSDLDIELTIISIVGTISQLTLSPYLCLLLLEGNPESETIFDEKNKKRIKKHLKNFLRTLLLKKD